MMFEKTVTYSVKFTAVVKYDPQDENLDDVISDIDIPEGGINNSVYVDNSFEVIDVERS